VAAVAATVAVLAVLGLVESGGDPARMFGADWSHVDWPSVASMLIVTGLIGALVVPLSYLLLPHGVRRVGAAFAAVAVVAPLGLIAPGFAYGEGGVGNVQAAFGYVPSGLKGLSGVFSAPLAGYNMPLPFFSEANAPLWHAGIGYELAGMIGVLAVGAAVYAIARGLRGRPDGPSPASGDR